jgi:hypothetical protein
MPEARNQVREGGFSEPMAAQCCKGGGGVAVSPPDVIVRLH